jgi:hypothetical protein
MSMPPPGILNPFDDDAQRHGRLDAQVETGRRWWRLVFVGGCAVVAAWAVLAVTGLPGTGIVLLPIGVGMILGSGIQLVVDRISG